MPGGPEVWLLGSSGWSADASAQLGLPYGAAHFINPSTTRRSVEHYLANFKPSVDLEAPRVLAAVGAVVADTAAEAERLHASQRLRRILRDLGESGPVPTPEDALARLQELGAEGIEERSEWPRTLVGDAAQVKARLEAMSEALGIDEFMLVTVVHSHEARRRSYELLADAFGLARPASSEHKAR
jgi:luciferase family oxidoreductase group 1